MRISKITMATLFVFAMAFASFGFAQDKPAAGAAPAEEIIAVMDMQAKPGMGLEWENYLKKDLLPAMKKAGMKNINAAMTDQFGVGDLYSFWWPITSLAEFDGPSPFAKALGTRWSGGYACQYSALYCQHAHLHAPFTAQSPDCLQAGLRNQAGGHRVRNCRSRAHG